MNDHVPAFSGLKTVKEPHLLQPGDLRLASNVRVRSGQAAVRFGLVPILHFADLATDYKLLWPASLPWLPVRNMDYAVSGTAYAAARAALKEFYGNQGGSADCQVLSDRSALQSRADLFTWEAKHFSYE